MSTSRWHAAARAVVIGVAAAVAVGIGGVAHAAAAPSGLDVSSHQHPNGAPIDWAAVRSSGRVFAFIKATEGDWYTNPYFADDWSASGNARLFRGAYHFARPSVGTAVGQADRFISVAGTARHRRDLPPVLDLEDSGGLAPSQLITWTQSFLNEVQRLTGRKPIIYTYQGFWHDQMADTTQFTGYPLWIATYDSSPSVGVWSTWQFWQYSYTEQIPGVPALVDGDQFNGTLRQLRALAHAHKTHRLPAGAAG